MEEDYLKQYQRAWHQDADDLLDKVAPPMDDLLQAVAHRERQRRSRRTAILSGIAAMLVLVVTVIFVTRPASEAPVVAVNNTQQPSAAVPQNDASHPLPQQPAFESDLAVLTPRPQETSQPLPAEVPETPVQGLSDQLPDGYAPQSNFEVAYLDDYYLDSLHSAPATLITAKDSAAWEWLSTQFALAPQTAAGNSQFVQRSYQISDKDNEPAGLDIDTGNYLLTALPYDHTVVVIHYESVSDLLELLNNTPNNYAENDTQVFQQSRIPRQKVPKDHEKVPNRHKVRIKNPTYYQAITPNSQNVKHYPK